MSATIRGFGLTEIKPQPGFTARIGENGGWTGKHSFAILTSAWNNITVRSRFAKGTQITTLDTDLSSFFSFLKIVEAEVVSEEGDVMMIGVDLAGSAGAQYGGEELGGDAEPTYRLNGSLQEAPFDEHPKWAALTEDQKAALGHVLTGALIWDAEQGQVCRVNPEAASSSEYFDVFLPYEDIITGDALEFANRIAQGKTTYLRPAITWTESTQGTSQLTADQLNSLGEIVSARGSPPEPTGGRDWMLTSAMQEQRGDQYTTDLEWTLSEKGGHDSFLYE